MCLPAAFSQVIVTTAPLNEVFRYSRKLSRRQHFPLRQLTAKEHP